ncbi:MAG: hypothetical protein OEW06_11505 [Gemmatimonadota bacterium]|nr:hypothetical protein [Gemmatimonadota bacterium]
MTLIGAPSRREPRRAVWLLAALMRVVAAPAAAQQPAPPPGESIANAVWRTRAEADGCLALPWSESRSTLSDRLLSDTCEITERGALPGAGGTSWIWTLSRRVLVYGPTPDTDPRDREFFPDTLLEAELVLFVADGDRIRPAWHDRSEMAIEFLRAPQALRVGVGDPLVVHRRCLNGTGGCMDHPYRLGSDGAVVPVVPHYRTLLRERLPADWGLWKGVWLDPSRNVADAPAYLAGDANCCPSFLATAYLRRSGDTLSTDTIAVTPTPGSGTWLVVPGERFGALDGETSEAALLRRLGPSAVTPAEIYLAEGFCTAGTRLFAGTTAEVEIGWMTAARARPAFVRTRVSVGPWRTPAGVRVGTTLAELERLAGAPLTFSGLGWDYGGGIVPSATA